MNREVKSFDEYIKVKTIEEEKLSSPKVDNIASSMGLDVKKDQLASGGPVESSLLDVVKEVENITGIELELTAGNDKYHHDKKREAAKAGRRYNSKHLSGDALDFVSKDRSIFNNDREARIKVERALAEIISSRKFKFGTKSLGAINEYDKSTKYKTAGHFHIDIRKGNPYIDLPLIGVNSISKAEKVSSRTVKKTSSDASSNIKSGKKTKSNTRFKIWDKDNRRILIAKLKYSNSYPNGYFKVYSRVFDKLGEVYKEGSSIILKDKKGKRDVTNGRIGKTFLNIFNKLEQSKPLSKSDTVISSEGSIKHTYSGKASDNINLIKKVAESNGITNQNAVIGILSVIGKESGFIPKSENLNYSSNRLPEVWGIFSKTGKRVPKGMGSSNANEMASEYANNPEKLANLVYSNKYGNGSEESGDGYKYRGRGFNQITFKGTYKKYSDILGVDLVNNPDLLNDPKIAANAAVQFLLNRLKSKGIDPNGFKSKDEAIKVFASANTGWGNDASREIAKADRVSKKFQIA
jgi:predicted chitinase